MTLDQLKYFLSVVKNRSYTLAAAELFVTESTISKSIKQLEEELNFQLFEKHGKELSLTANGSNIYLNVTEVFHNISQIQTYAQSLNRSNYKEIRIGSNSTFLLNDMVPIIQKYETDYILSESLVSHGRFESSLINDLCDIVISYKPIENPQLFCTKIGNGEFVILIPKDTDFISTEEVSLDSLSGKHLLLCYHESSIPKTYLKYFESMGIIPIYQKEGSFFYSKLENGLFPALITKESAMPFLNRYNMHTITNEAIAHFGYYITYRKSDEPLYDSIKNHLIKLFDFN